MGKVTLGLGPKMKVPPRETELGPHGTAKLPTLKMLLHSGHLGAIFIKESEVVIKKAIFSYNHTLN